ncbi:Type III restriction enzyme, res subunit [Musa troglodytarum]|uniref:Type III restriction enzyme, res subunit n=1 Tax=Musa troglodytarum TaxID=320322 RepID=A0A9E7H135_9LILI|nr:Type III restriction enzyme, res subunit [Musa troglodytarum]URE25561.1 Type III restriction enzyme, res subunit [Musa troglodytarum]
MMVAVWPVSCALAAAPEATTKSGRLLIESQSPDGNMGGIKESHAISNEMLITRLELEQLFENVRVT